MKNISFSSEELYLKFFNIKEQIKKINITMGNFNFKLLNKFEELGIDLNEIEELNIIISANGRTNVFKNFVENEINTKYEIEELLEKNLFQSFEDVNDSIKDKIIELFDEGKFNIKIGFKNDKSFLINDELLIGDKYHIIGNFNEQKLLEPLEHYCMLSGEEALHGNVNFEKKFKLCFPFHKEELDTFIDAIDNILNTYRQNNIELRDYQKDAINELIKNDFNGKVQMATGTGKTLTTLCGLKEYIKVKKLNKPQIITLIVPLKLLVNQWENEIEKVFGSIDFFAKRKYKIYKCYSDNPLWKEALECYVNFKDDYEVKFIIFVIDSFRTYIEDSKNVMKLKEFKSMLIVDEAHNMTKNLLKDVLSINMFKSHLGLSATIYSDDNRKNELLDYFFEGADIYFGIERALDEGYLCQYNYIPQVVELNSDEVIEYKKNRNKLDKLIELEQFGDEYMRCLKKESELISGAHRKVEHFKEDIKSLESKDNMLIYSNQGKYGNEKYIDYLVKTLENEIGIVSKKITSKEKQNERTRIIKGFENQEVQAICAIKCLDEGVDIPSIKRAFLLYSGGTGKEYVQRRGRILRKYEGKQIAFIHDYVVKVDGIFPSREKRRFQEYVSVAKNKEDLKEEIKMILGSENAK